MANPTFPGQPYDAPSFIEKASKAVAGGVTGAATGGVGSSIALALSDGSISGADVWAIVTIALAGFVTGFAGVYAAPANATGAAK